MGMNVSLIHIVIHDAVLRNKSLMYYTSIVIDIPRNVIETPADIEIFV